ncbi:hypothetical protein L9F63_012529, partial [Diploptera punctata]
SLSKPIETLANGEVFHEDHVKEDSFPRWHGSPWRWLHGSVFTWLLLYKDPAVSPVSSSLIHGSLASSYASLDFVLK